MQEGRVPALYIIREEGWEAVEDGRRAIRPYSVERLIHIRERFYLCTHCAAHFPFAGTSVHRKESSEEKNFHFFGDYLGCNACQALTMLLILKERRWEKMSHKERIQWDRDYQKGLVK